MLLSGDLCKELTESIEMSSGGITGVKKSSPDSFSVSCDSSWQGILRGTSGEEVTSTNCSGGLNSLRFAGLGGGISSLTRSPS